MSYNIELYTDLRTKLDKLNIKADKNFCFLPENLSQADNSSKLIYPETTTEIKKILKTENVSIEYLTEDKPLLRTRKYADWFGPTLFIGVSLLTENSNLIGISLNLISSYLYDLFKGTIADKKIKFDIVIETKKREEYQKISYEGNIEGIKELENIIKQLKK